MLQLSLFKNVPIAEWKKAHPESKPNEDIDSIQEFENSGFIPAGWIIKQLGLNQTKMGTIMLSDDDPNNALFSGTVDNSYVFELTSFLKQQVRDRLGIQLILSSEVEKLVQK